MFYTWKRKSKHELYLRINMNNQEEKPSALKAIAVIVYLVVIVVAMKLLIGQ